MTTNKPEVVAWSWDYRGQLMLTTVYSRALELAEPPYPTEVEPLIRLSDYEKLAAECEKLVQVLRRISYQASRHECRQTPASDLQRAFADLMRQADDALYCFYNDMLHKQRFCEYAGCCEPAVAEALCRAHLEDWREKQVIDAAMEERNP